MFKNRREAGYMLAEELAKNEIEFDVVLAIPRGGVVVGEIIATRFNKPLDVVMARKIGSPNWEEFAVGAVTPDGHILVHDRVKGMMDGDTDTVTRLAERVRRNIVEWLKVFRGTRPPLDLKEKRVLLVDDGIATGFTVKAAVDYILRSEAREVIIAVPVSSPGAYSHLIGEVKEVVALAVPQEFYAVGQYYDDFRSVEDQEVVEILKRC